MLTKTDYLELLTKEPEETFFYHDRPVVYTIQHNGESYLIALADEDNDKQAESFLLVHYSDITYILLEQKVITLREFYIHPNNTVHLVLLEYTENGPVVLSGGKYEDNLTIPDEYLPTADARWK